MNMKKIIIICAVIVAFPGLAHGNAYGVDPCLPDDFPEFIINQYGETAPGYVIGSVRSRRPDVGSYFVILENSGNPVFYSKTQSLGRLRCNGLFALHKNIPGQNKKYTWHLYEDFNEVDTFQMGNGHLADSHDFQILPNGHALMFSYSSHIIDMSEIVEGGHPAASVGGAVIQELDVHKNVIFQWRSIDYVPVTDTYQNVTRPRFPSIHVNTIELDATDGNIILSCRASSNVIKISRVTGEVMWRLCGKQNEFTFINEHEENAPRYFKFQHDARRYPNGNLSLFDNGINKNDMERTYSRAVEYALDEENKTATMVWEYRNDPDFLAMSAGNCIRQSNGNTLIRWGSAASSGNAAAMTEVDPNGQLVYEIWPAQNKVTAVTSPFIGFERFVWPLEDQSTTVTHDDLIEGSEYVFNDTGVTLNVNSLDGDANSEVSVKRAPFAPPYPEFGGKAPRVLPVRVKVNGSGINSMMADISFDAESFGFADRSGALGYADPQKLTIYHRPVPGQGLFTALRTIYNPGKKRLRTTMTQFGEFIFCFPDLEEVPYAPLLIEPEGQTVNQELPVPFFWTPRGFGRSYHLQVSKDPQFSTLEFDEPNLMETRYTLGAVDADTTYYYRVNTTNYGGTSEWATASFQTVPPMIEVTVPNGGEQWNRGLDFFIQWNDNIDEDVVLELYKGGTLVRTIRTVSSIGVYEWEVNLDLEPGCDYSIKIKSSADEALFDMSDDTFAIDPTDTIPPEFEFSVTPTILWPANHKMVLITPSWTASDETDPTPEVSLVSVVSNEDDDTKGDGHTSDDIQIGDDGSIYLRAERSGTGSDRIYTITYQAVDDCGNVTERSATVGVPHELKSLERIGDRWIWKKHPGDDSGEP